FPGRRMDVGIEFGLLTIISLPPRGGGLGWGGERLSGTAPVLSCAFAPTLTLPTQGGGILWRGRSDRQTICDQRRHDPVRVWLTALVDFEDFAHRRQQRLFRLAAVGGGLIAPPVPAVDVEVSIEKEALPGRVVVEFESGQVHAVHAGNPRTLEAHTEG